MSWCPFLTHPELAVACAVLFLIAGVLARVCRAPSKWLLVVSGLWLVYAVWEYYCTVGEYNIRVDLLVLPFLLVGATVVALVLTAMPYFRKE